jgi:hypothetical protein
VVEDWEKDDPPAVATLFRVTILRLVRATGLTTVRLRLGVFSMSLRRDEDDIILLDAVRGSLGVS